MKNCPLQGISDLAPFALTVCTLRARTINADFGGAKRRRNPHVEKRELDGCENMVPRAERAEPYFRRLGRASRGPNGEIKPTSN
jgi:hypothetical protein